MRNSETGNHSSPAEDIFDIVDDEEDVQWDDRLSSEDINDLLGFDLSSSDGFDRSGLRALINSALVTHRRMPVLDVIFDRAARGMTSNLRHFTNDNVDVSLDDVSFTRFGDFVHSIPSPSVIGVLKSEALENFLLIAIDANLVYSVVDLLLGGQQNGESISQIERKFTPIELALTESVFDQLSNAIESAFEPVTQLGLSLDRTETTPQFVAIAQGASVCSLAKYQVQMEGRGGRVVLLAPHATLEPIQKLLHQDFIGETASNRLSWRDDLKKELSEIKFDLNAVIAEKEVTIKEVEGLAVGQTITFGAGNPRGADVRVGNAILARGALGQRNGSIALRICEAMTNLDENTAEVSAQDGREVL